MVFLTEEDISNELKKKWNEISGVYSPDLIIAISQGANFIREKLSTITGIETISLAIGRPDRTNLWKKISKFNKKLASLMYEVCFLIDEPKILHKVAVPSSRKILIVDDGIHTGKTIKTCIQYLGGFSPVEIKVFSFMDLSKESISDYSICTEKVSFPWAKNRQNSR